MTNKELEAAVKVLMAEKADLEAKLEASQEPEISTSKPQFGPSRWTKQDDGKYTLTVTVKDIDFTRPVGKTKSKNRKDYWLFQSEGTKPNGDPTPFYTLSKSPNGHVIGAHFDVIQFQEVLK